MAADPDRIPVARRLGLALTRSLHAELAALAVFAVAAFGLLAFLGIADEMTEGDTRVLDRALLLALRDPGQLSQPLGPHWLRLAAADLTALGSITVLGLATATVAALFLTLGRRLEAGLIVLAAGGGLALSQGLKHLFGRDRPDAAWHAVEVANPSFPSGHAMLSAVVFLTLGALLARFAVERRVKVWAMSAAVTVTLLVGASRVYLGVHWPTDVLAGWCLGCAWAATCWLIAWLAERRGRPTGG